MLSHLNIRKRMLKIEHQDIFFKETEEANQIIGHNIESTFFEDKLNGFDSVKV